MKFEYGYDSQGIENLLDEVKGMVLTKAAGHAITELKTINDACDKNWTGQSKDDFKSHLKKDAQEFASALKVLYDAFEKEIANAGYDFNRFDKNLFNKF